MRCEHTIITDVKVLGALIFIIAAFALFIELLALVYIGYISRSLLQIRAPKPRRELGLCAGAVGVRIAWAIGTIVLFMVIMDLWRKPSPAIDRFTVYVLTGLGSFWILSALTVILQHSLFDDFEAAVQPLWAGVAVTGVSAVAFAVSYTPIGGSEGVLAIYWITALAVWHTVNGVRTHRRACTLRAMQFASGGVCRSCSYPVASVVGGKCPECGAVIATPPTTKAPSDFKSEI